MAAAALASQALLLSLQLLISAPHYIFAVSPLVWSNQVRVVFFFFLWKLGMTPFPLCEREEGQQALLCLVVIMEL